MELSDSEDVEMPDVEPPKAAPAAGVERKTHAAAHHQTYDPFTSKLSRAEKQLLQTDSVAQALWARAKEFDGTCCQELIVHAKDGQYQSILNFFSHSLLQEAWTPQSYMDYFAHIATECMNHSALISDRGFIQNITDSLTTFSGHRVALSPELFWLVFLHSSHNLVTLNEVYACLVPGQWDRVVSILLTDISGKPGDAKSTGVAIAQVICNLLVSRANRYQHAWLRHHLKIPELAVAPYLKKLKSWLEGLFLARPSIGVVSKADEVKEKKKPPAPSAALLSADEVVAIMDRFADDVKGVVPPPEEFGDARSMRGPAESIAEGDEEFEDGSRESSVVSEATEVRMYRMLTRSKRKPGGV